MNKLLSLILIISLILLTLVGCIGGSTDGNQNGGNQDSGNQNGDGSSSDSAEKQVPIYQGMSITSAKESASHTRLPSVMAGNNNGNGNNGDNGNHYGQYKGDHSDKDKDADDEKPFPDNNENENIEEEIKSSLKVIGSPDTIYYASVGQDIYINIHINNPDSFEIMSFTLNGKKYSSYMFEDGSDMETIILKYNVGEASGIIDYTIDAIKYVDGTEIKDVIIDGDKTVRAGVRKDNQVVANVSDIKIGTDSISFNVNVKDNDNLIAFADGKIHAVLYDGDEIVEQLELSIGENSISFNGLKANRVYQYAIVGHYDNLSGDGFCMNLLYKDAFMTEAIVLFDDITIGQEIIDFSFDWHENYQNATLTSLKLYHGEKLDKELSLEAQAISGLLSGNTYSLVAEYDHNGTTESIQIEFTTFAKGIPGITLSGGETTKTSISFNVTEMDAENIGSISKIELIHASGTIVADNVDVREFIGLLSDNDYTIRVTYSYDLNDGEGVQSIVRETSAHTHAKIIPTGSIENIVATKDSISFETQETDPDNVGEITKIELVHKNGTIVADNVDVREFTGLLSDNDYTIRVTYTYDFNDGRGQRIITKEKSAHTSAKNAPSISIINIASTKVSISFEIKESYTEIVGEIIKIELVHTSGTIVADDVDVREFTSLLSNNEYTIKVYYAYDLNDGKGVRTTTKTASIRTKAKSVPTVTIRNVVATEDSIGFEIQEYHSDVVPTLVKIELVHTNGTIAADNVDVREFKGLLSNNSYTIQVTYEYDLNDGNGAKQITRKYTASTLAKTAPSVYIFPNDHDLDHVYVEFVQYGDVDTVKSWLLEVIDGNGNVVATETEMSDYIEFDNLNLLSNHRYNVKCTCTYDLNDGKGLQEFVYESSFGTRSCYIPDFNIGDAEISMSSIKAAFSIEDIDKTLVDYRFDLYKGTELIASAKEINFSSLEAYTDYTLKLIYSYDLRDGVGVQNKTADFTYTTSPYIDVLECKIANTSAVSEGETIFMQVKLDNPHNVAINSVVINGETYSVTGASTPGKIFVEIVYNGQFAGGDTYLKIDSLNATHNDNSFSVKPNTELSDHVFINGILEVLSIEFVNENLVPFESGDWVFPSDKIYVLITLDNPTGYEIDSFSNYTKLDNNRYYYPASSWSNWSYRLSISSISYHNDYISKTTAISTVYNEATVYMVVSDEIKYISTPNDLKNMNGGYYYKMTGDIDLSGLEWLPSTFNGVFEGNGYAIKNMSFIGTVNNSSINLGLFKDATGVVQNLIIQESTIIADIARDNDNGYSAYCGTITSTVSNYFSLRNCTIDENSTISITNKFGSNYVGGFIGYANYEAFIDQCTNSGNVSSDNSASYYVRNSVGGFIGLGHGIIKNSNNNGSVTSSETYRTHVGGFVGRYYTGLNNSGKIIIENCINNGRIEGGENSGGLIAEIAGTDSSELIIILNCINTGDIVGTNVGGLIGSKNYHDRSGKILIENSLNIGSIKGISNNSKVGDLYSDYYTSATVINSYAFIQDTGVQNGTLCTIEEANSKKFYTDTLGWSEDVWDLSELDIQNSKYPKLKQN